MRYEIYLTDQSSRQLLSVLKLGSTTMLLFTYNVLNIVNDKIEFFRSLTLNIENTQEVFIQTESDLLINIIDGEGYLLIDIEDSKATYGFAKDKERFKDDDYESVSSGVSSILTKSLVSDFLHLIMSTKDKTLELDSLNNLKSLISACTVTEQGIVISEGLAVTDSDKIIMYQKLKDTSLNIGLSCNALKEMDKFKLDCKISQSQNYILLSRDNFTLAVRKSVIKEQMRIPADYTRDNTANCSFFIDLTSLSKVLNSCTPKMIQDSVEPCMIKIELETETCEVNVSRKSFIYNTEVKGYKQNNRMSIGSLNIKMGDMISISKLLSQKEQLKVKYIQLIVYPKNTRIVFNDGNNALIRSVINANV